MEQTLSVGWNIPKTKLKNKKQNTFSHQSEGTLASWPYNTAIPGVWQMVSGSHIVNSRKNKNQKEK